MCWGSWLLLWASLPGSASQLQVAPEHLDQTPHPSRLLILPDHGAWKEQGEAEGISCSVQDHHEENSSMRNAHHLENESVVASFSINKRTHHYILIIGTSPPTGRPKYFQWPNSDLLSRKWPKSPMSYGGTSLDFRAEGALADGKWVLASMLLLGMQRTCTEMAPCTKIYGASSVTPLIPSTLTYSTREFYQLHLS